MDGRYGNCQAGIRAVRTTNDLHLPWDIPYETGTLKAVGTRDGKVACTVELSTTGDPAAVSLSADCQTIPAGRRGTAHVTVQIVDEQGRMVPTASNEIAFAVEGEARIIGVDNGVPKSHEDYKGSRRKAFNGLSLAILQSTGRPGPVCVSAVSPGLRPAVLEFT